MSERTVTIRLNQQQWELVDKTVSEGIAPSREALFKRALREFCTMPSEESDDAAGS